MFRMSHCHLVVLSVTNCHSSGVSCIDEHTTLQTGTDHNEMLPFSVLGNYCWQTCVVRIPKIQISQANCGQNAHFWFRSNLALAALCTETMLNRILPFHGWANLYATD